VTKRPGIIIGVTAALVVGDPALGFELISGSHADPYNNGGPSDGYGSL
jgi:hypothetical protein